MTTPRRFTRLPTISLSCVRSSRPCAGGLDAGAGSPARGEGVIVRASFAHHAGMSMVALANAVTGDRMIERFVDRVPGKPVFDQTPRISLHRDGCSLIAE